jgi:hypothetical protein
VARQYAPLYTSIWQDDTFTALPVESQWVYLLALSQPNMTYCGVVPFTARRWASYAAGATARTVVRAIAPLSSAGLVMLDDEAEELWVRSFVKHNKVTQQPKILLAAKRQFGEVVSEPIRNAIVSTYPGVFDTPADTPDGRVTGSPSVGFPATSGLGVEGDGSSVQGQDLTLNPESSTSSPVVDDSFAKACRRAAEDECRMWLERDPKGITSPAGWIDSRTATLLEKKYQLAVDNPDADEDELYRLISGKPNPLRVIEGAVCSQEGCVGGMIASEGPDENGYSYSTPCPKCTAAA